MAALYTPREKGRKPLLGITDPRVSSSLAALDLTGCNIADITAFGNRLQRDADAWLRRGGLADRGRISKRDAHHMLKAALAKAGEA